MDGRGRALDNIFIERLWRTVKYEEIYLKEYETVKCLHSALREYFDFYNNERLHQSLNYQTPKQVHFSNDKKNILLLPLGGGKEAPYGAIRVNKNPRRSNLN